MSKTCPICGASYDDSSVFCSSDGTTLRTDEAAGDLVGSVIADRYKITKLLGEGGMGRVYLAEHVRLPQKAAIKVLHPGMVKDNDAVARFNREAANAAKIEHDRVARVFDFGETRDGLVYLAMEFVPGRTLRSLLMDDGTVSPTRAANLAFQIAEGLDAAHRIGIVHRDLKPDNIIVMTDDQGIDRSKVVDFGIAKAVGGSDTQLTRTGMVVGTPEFMSPEQVLGEPLDARSDVYALALVSYQMLTGMLPFSSSTPERSLTARLIEDPRPLSVAVPEVSWPSALQAALDHALAREPDQRTASALEFAEAMVAATESWTGLPVLRPRTPMSTSAITAATNAARPGPTPVLGGTPAPQTTVAAASTAGVTPAVAIATSAPQKVRRKGPVFVGGGLLAVAAIAAIVMNQSRSTPPPSASTQQTSAGEVTKPAPPSAEALANAQTPPAGSAQAAGTTQGSNAGASAATASGARALPATPTPVPDARALAPPTASSASPSVVNGVSAAAVEAKRLLSAIRKELDDVSEGSAALIGAEDALKLRALLVDMPTRADSALTYETLALAYFAADRPESACSAFASARQLAVTPARRDMLRQMSLVEPFLTCRP